LLRLEWVEAIPAAFEFILRPSGALTAPAPDKTNADISHVVAVASVVGGGSEGIEKPFVAVTKIYERLVGDK
jgi:hypothetical protein